VALVRAVAQVDHQLVLRRLLDHREISDLSFLLEYLGNCDEDLGCGHGCFGFPGHSRIADPRQHVADGVVHAHASRSPLL
jgi:hypothetical protein